MDFKWSKQTTPNQKRPSDLEAVIIHSFPEHHTPFNFFQLLLILMH